MFIKASNPLDFTSLVKVSLKVIIYSLLLSLFLINTIKAESDSKIYEEQLEINIHMLGSEGALVISEARPEVGIYYRDQPAKEFRHRRIGIDNDFLLMEDLARAIDSDGETILDAESGRAITATVEAAVVSGKTGVPVDVG